MLLWGPYSVADSDLFDTDPEPAFQIDTDPDPIVLYGSGSLPFQGGNVPKTVPYLRTIYTFLLDFPCQ